MKKLLLSAALAVTATTGFTASADMIEDLTNLGYGVWLRQSDKWYDSKYEAGGTMKITRYGNNQIAISGFPTESPHTFIFDVNGNTLTIANNGKSIDRYEGQYLTIEALVNKNGTSIGSMYGLTDEKWSGTISTEGDEFNIEFGPFMIKSDNPFNSTTVSYVYSLAGELTATSQRYHSLKANVFKPNGWATDELLNHDLYVEESRRYPVKVYPDGSVKNRYRVHNFYENGWSVNTSNKFEDPYFTVTNEVSDDSGDYMELSFPRQNALNAFISDGCWAPERHGNYHGWQTHEYRSLSVDDYGFNVGGATYGIMQLLGGHTEDHNHWAKHEPGGLLETQIGEVINFAPMTTYAVINGWTSQCPSSPWSDYGRSKYHPGYKAMDAIANGMQIDLREDVTPHIDIEMDEQGYGCDNVNGIYVSGVIKPINIHDDIEQYIDHLELYLVDESINTVANVSTNMETGLSRGMNIHFDYNLGENGAKKIAKANSVRDEIPFQKLIPVSSLPADFKYDKGHTLYVKTVYNHPIFTPSYHALTPLSKVTTGISDVTVSENVTISTAAGTISVAGAEGAEVEVYTAAGVQVYAGTDSEIAVKAGLYIVKVGSKVQKVVVR